MPKPRRGPRTLHREPPRGPDQLVGVHCAVEALRARRRDLRVLRVRKGPQRAEVEAVVELAREAGVFLEPVSPEKLEQLAGRGENNQGVVLEAGPLPEVDLPLLLGPPDDADRTLVALDGVEDPRNLGAIARVAEGAGVAGLILTRRRSAPLSPTVARASAGAIEWLPVARVPNLPRALGELKSNGFWVFGSDPQGDVDLFELPDRAIEGRRVVVLGAEGRGVRRGVDRELDFRVRIPLEGEVASLNVSTASAVMLFELARRSRRNLESGG